MAHLKCNCGERLSNVCFPNVLEGDLRGSYEYEDRDVWECPYCGRLAIDIKDEKGLTIVKWYKPEDGKVGELFHMGTSDQFLKHLEKFWLFHEEDLKKLGIIQDKEPILNACIQEQQKQIHELTEKVETLEEFITGI